MSLIVGLVIGLVTGGVIGVAASQNFYEYHVVDRTHAETGTSLVNQGGWEPVPGSFESGGTNFYRRPRIRLGS